MAILCSSHLGSTAAAALAGVAGYDLLQRRRAILRNFPVIGHLRYLLEVLAPSFASTSPRPIRGAPVLARSAALDRGVLGGQREPGGAPLYEI